MDEILQHCRHLCSNDFRVRADAYQSLRSSRAFSMVVQGLREFNMTFFDVARLLIAGRADPVARKAHQLLSMQLALVGHHESRAG